MSWTYQRSFDGGARWTESGILAPIQKEAIRFSDNYKNTANTQKIGVLTRVREINYIPKAGWPVKEK